LDNRCTFDKTERIFLKKEIDGLFKQGDSFISYPLRIIYLNQKPLSGATVSVLISVPKKNIKRAVNRNRIKRLIREAYRLNKSNIIQFCQEKGNGFLIAFLFIGNELCKWKDIENAMLKTFGILKDKMK